MTELPEPAVKPALYEVSLLPEGDVNYRVFAVTVERHDGRWAVVHAGDCLGSDDTWSHRVKPHGRGDDWLSSHRFDLETALRLAQIAASNLSVNGMPIAVAYEKATQMPRAIGRKDAEAVEFGDSRLPARFWQGAKAMQNGCWAWQRKLATNGYARFKHQGRRYMAHRLAYEALVGPIPNGMQLDHVCHNLDTACAGGPSCLHRRCVNPAHLEPVTGYENTIRRMDFNGSEACPKGHTYDVANTLYNAQGGRLCRTCQRLRSRARAAGRAAS